MTDKYPVKVYSPPPTDPSIPMGELVKFQQRQFSALSNSLRLAIWYNKRANPDYRTRTFFSAVSGRREEQS